MFKKEFIEKYSWTGRHVNKNTERKKPFMIFVNVIDLIFKIVNNGCPDYDKIQNEADIQKYLKYLSVPFFFFV